MSRRAVLKARVQLCLEVTKRLLERCKTRFVTGGLSLVQLRSNPLDERALVALSWFLHAHDYDRLDDEDPVLRVVFFAVVFFAVVFFFLRSDSSLFTRRSIRSRSRFVARPRLSI